MCDVSCIEKKVKKCAVKSIKNEHLKSGITEDGMEDLRISEIMEPRTVQKYTKSTRNINKENTNKKKKYAVCIS